MSVRTGVTIYIARSSKSNFLVRFCTWEAYESPMIVYCISLLFKYMFYYELKKKIVNITKGCKVTGERVKHSDNVIM